MKKDKLKLTHLSKKGKPKMVDVSAKKITTRIAKAQSEIIFGHSMMDYLKSIHFGSKKGSILQTASLAGTMAVKNTASLIPLCHPLQITNCSIKFKKKKDRLKITCKVACNEKTGIEMEALTGASVAALTVYDMCKAISHNMVISETKLLKKTGGKSDYEA